MGSLFRCWPVVVTSVAVTVMFLGGALARICPQDTRPYTCEQCIHFRAKNVFNPSICGERGSLVEIDDESQFITLKRYVEVLDDKFWIGYIIKTNKAESLTSSTVPDFLKTFSPQNCSDQCCGALQSDGLVAVKCNEELPSVCTLDANFNQIEQSSVGSADDSMSLTIMLDGQSVNEMNVSFGSDIILSCYYLSADDIVWYVNGKMRDRTSQNATHSWLELQFATSGVYQCGLKNLNVISSVTLCGVDGNPGDVRVISSAQSQSEIYVSWYPPSVLGTADPYLLRYTVYYTSDEFLDISTAQSVNALPRLLNGVSYEGIGEFVLKNLTAGKTYSVSVVANTLMSAPKSDVKFIAVASTYGNVPTDSVSNLKMQWIDDDMNLHVTWDAAQLQPPLGPVALYEVEYRDAQQLVSTTANVQHPLHHLIIHDVTNANDYEVRVRILVEVERARNPLYSASNWSNWVTIRGTTTPVPPEPVDTKPSVDIDKDVVISAVIVPLAVVIILVLLLVVAIIGYGITRKSKKDEDSIKSVHLQPFAEPTNADLGTKTDSNV